MFAGSGGVGRIVVRMGIERSQRVIVRMYQARGSQLQSRCVSLKAVDAFWVPKFPSKRERKVGIVGHKAGGDGRKSFARREPLHVMLLMPLLTGARALGSGRSWYSLAAASTKRGDR